MVRHFLLINSQDVCSVFCIQTAVLLLANCQIKMSTLNCRKIPSLDKKTTQTFPSTSLKPKTLYTIFHKSISRSIPTTTRIISAQATDDALTPTSTSVQQQQPFTTHSWKWRGNKIKYATAGCGQPILLVHGFGASLGHWKRNIPILAENGYKVYAIDLLGFGGSDKPILDYTMELWAEQIVDFLKEFCGPDKPCIVVGNSVGSLATLMVSSSHPELVSGTILLNCAGGMNNKAISDDWRIKLALPLFYLIDWLFSQPTIARSLFDKFRQPDSLRNVLLNVYRNPIAVDDDLVDMLYQPSCDQGALECFVSVITGPPGPRPEQLVPKLKKPMLILWGTDDPFTPGDGPVGKYFRSLHNNNSTYDTNNNGAKIEFIDLEGVGHCPQDEEPEKVHEYMLPWLAKTLAS
jgi:pimeloyl-ACP methyl ester carboxylesterase